MYNIYVRVHLIQAGLTPFLSAMGPFVRAERYSFLRFLEVKSSEVNLETDMGFIGACDKELAAFPHQHV